MNCDKCKLELEKNSYIETINNKKLCFGCDTKRLINETSGKRKCSCPSWIFKKGHKLDCKHIYEVKNDLAYKHQNNLIENISEIK